MINVTNDGWFGISSGPYQHFQQARVRAIEEGLPLVRAANTGISAVVDPLGRVIEKLPLGAEGVIDAPLPQPIAAPPYAGVGDVPAAKERRLAIEAIDAAPRPNNVVRRYREEPPLVRDAAGQWRSGRLDLVLGGAFDLLQAGQR